MKTTAIIQNQCDNLSLKIIGHYLCGELGGTFNFDAVPQKFETGYLASYKTPSIVFKESKFPKVFELSEMIKKLYFKASSSDFIGFWVNEGKIYIDLTRHIVDKKPAILFGINQDQIAIWDCEKNKLINLN